MNKGRKLCVAAVLALVLLVAFGATASPPPLPSSFYDAWINISVIGGR